MGRKPKASNRVVSVKLLPDGKWRVNYFRGGKRKSRTFDSEQQALDCHGRLEEEFAGAERARASAEAGVARAELDEVRRAAPAPTEEEKYTAADPVAWLAMLWRAAGQVEESMSSADCHIDDKRRSLDAIAKAATAAQSMLKYLEPDDGEDGGQLAHRSTSDLVDAASAVVAAESGGRQRLAIVDASPEEQPS